jgi:DNA polymerase-3 subunit beta
MEFTVRKFDLLQELTLIQGVVERKTTIPILANVLVRAEGGELHIAATDLEIGLKSVCPSKTTRRLSCSSRRKTNGRKDSV